LAPATSLVGTSALGTVTPTAAATVQATGFSMTAGLTSVVVWSTVPATTPATSWTGTVPATPGTWVEVTPSTSGTWIELKAA